MGIHAGASLFNCAAGICWGLFALKILFKKSLEKCFGKELKKKIKRKGEEPLEIRPQPSQTPPLPSLLGWAWPSFFPPRPSFPRSQPSGPARQAAALSLFPLWPRAGAVPFSHRQLGPTRQPPLSPSFFSSASPSRGRWKSRFESVEPIFLALFNNQAPLKHHEMPRVVFLHQSRETKP